MINNLQSKKKNWINSTISCTNLTNFTLKKIIQTIKSKKLKKNSFHIFNINKLLNTTKSIRNKIITKGSVVTILLPKFRGKKAVVLETTESGMSVISGPRMLNGLSLHRINFKYLLPVKFQINIYDINTKYLTDTYFQVLKKSKKKNNQVKARIVLSNALRQIYIDRCLLKKINNDIFLNAYLKSNHICTFL